MQIAKSESGGGVRYEFATQVPICLACKKKQAAATRRATIVGVVVGVLLIWLLRDLGWFGVAAGFSVGAVAAYLLVGNPAAIEIYPPGTGQPEAMLAIRFKNKGYARLFEEANRGNPHILHT